MKRFLTMAILAFCTAGLIAGTALAQDRTTAPAEAGAYIISPLDGATVSSPVLVVFGQEGIGVAPAGSETENTGHHHHLIDTEPPSMDEPIPGDDNHVHFGGGQTQAELELEPGSHTLQLLLGDLNHIPHDPPIMSDRITITVE
jgi:hypothetical protein